MLAIAPLLLAACGGGGDGGSAAPPPSQSTPSPKAMLTAANYKSAVNITMGSAATAFAQVLVGLRFAHQLMGQQVTNFLVLPCTTSGGVELELTDRNGNHILEQNDTVHIRWHQCVSGGSSLDGLMRIEVVAYTPTAQGYEMQLTITAVSVSIAPGIDGQGTSTLNFIAPVVLTHGPTWDSIQLASGVFRGVPTASGLDVITVGIGMQQDYAQGTYQLTTFGTVDTDTLGGHVDFSTDVAFAGTLGRYPDSGRLALSGGAGSSARLAEEGAAAGDPATVLAGVDSNGDGAADASDAALGWSTILPVTIFESVSGSFD